MRRLGVILCFMLQASLAAQGPFDPPAGMAGSSAINKDSSLISGWAQNIEIWRGYQDIARPGLGKVSHGDTADALGPADGMAVSFGDSGYVLISLPEALYDQAGPEFAVFENSFSDQYLELARVAVSADGQHFFNFPAVSLTDTQNQVGSFGSIDARQIQNLAGKYRKDYGTPFDLADIREPALPDSIFYLRITDVVGSIDANFGTRDSRGKLINDPYPTAFASGGFDLDAVAFLTASSLELMDFETSVNLFYPNPSHGIIHFKERMKQIRVYSLSGELIMSSYPKQKRLSLEDLKAGIYIIQMLDDSDQWHRAKLYRQ